MELNKEAEEKWLEEKRTIERSLQISRYGFESDGNTPAGEKIPISDSEAMVLLIKMAESSDFYDYNYGGIYRKRHPDFPWREW